MTDKIARSVDKDLATVPIGTWFKITPTGLGIKGKPPIEAFAELGEALRTFERTLQFAIGDWINALEDRYGEEASQLIDASGWSLNTIRVYSWTAKNVPPANRFIDEGLTYAHHQAVASLAHPEQKHWLKLALGDGDEPWPVSKLRAAISRGADLTKKYWVVIVCKDEDDQAALVKELERQGRTCKSMER
jgi:hypothetical protein